MTPDNREAHVGSLNSDEVRALELALPAYLARQRWFGEKSHGIREVRLLRARPLDAHNILALVEVTGDDGTASLYQLPIAKANAVASSALLKEHPESIIALTGVGDDQGALYEPTHEPNFLRLLVGEVVDQHAPSGLTSEGVAALKNASPRLLRAEQSNTNVLYGQQALLKLFRHIRPGINPDVEILRFLTAHTDFPATPRYLGELSEAVGPDAEADQTTLAFLLSFVANEGDGWEWYLTQLKSARPADWLPAIEQLGSRTAQMHLALATPTDLPSFGVEPCTTAYLADVVSSARALAENAHASLVVAMDRLEGAALADAQQVIERWDELMRPLLRPHEDEAALGSRIRIHGDYHLGQVLRTADDFVILDFEGEPARTLEQRRRRQSPLKDVAGMLRSFHYAAETARMSAESTVADESNQAAQAFLRSYRNAIAAQPALTPGGSDFDQVLQVFLLEKTMYEVLYELNNRPTWLRIPLQGLLSLLNSRASIQGGA